MIRIYGRNGFNIKRFTLFGTMVACLIPLLCWAESWPDKPIRLVIPYSAGGTTDQVGRLLAQKLSNELGQKIIVENKPGANGHIAATYVSKSPADGYTLLLAAGNLIAMNSTLYQDSTVDYEHDFAYIAEVASGPMLIAVRPNMPVQNITEFLAYAKTHTLNVGSAGSGSQTHLAALNLMAAADIVATHIPYKGEAGALNDLSGGQIDLLVSNLSASLELAKGAKIKPLAVTSATRVEQLSEIPSVLEVGLPDAAYEGWYGLVVHANTPTSIIDKIDAANLNVRKDDSFKYSLALKGMTPGETTRTTLKARIQTETVKLKKLTISGL